MDALVAEIAQMEEDVSNVTVPLGYAGQLFDLRLHIELVAGKTTSAGQPR